MSDELERLRAVIEAATPGPWHALWGSRDVLDMVHAEGPDGTIVLASVHDLKCESGDANARAIAAAVTLLPALLAVAEAMPAMVDRLDDAMGDTDPDDPDDPDVRAMATAVAALRGLCADTREHLGDA